jgi:hypothetical protein
MNKLERFVIMVIFTLMFTSVHTTILEEDPVNQEVQNPNSAKKVKIDGLIDVGLNEQPNEIKEELVKPLPPIQVGSPKKRSLLKPSSNDPLVVPMHDIRIQELIKHAMENQHRKAKAMLNANAKCNQNILKAFGVRTPTYKEPQIASAHEKAFCRRNRNTCCSAADFHDVIDHFTDNAKKFLRSFQPIEELLTLFKGNNYQNYFGIIAGNVRCKYVVKDIVDPEGKDPFYFYNKYTQSKLDDIYSLLNDIEMFLKRQLWFHGNFMCAICNPNENPYFEFKAGGSIIKSLTHTCIDVLEGVDYQIRLASLYNTFFKFILKLIKCNDDPDSTDNSEPIIPEIDEAKLEKLDDDYLSCSNNLKETNPSCVAICSKRLSRFVPDIEYFTPYRVALSMIYAKFVEDGDISEYYHTVYQKEYPSADPTDISFYDTNTAEWKEYELDGLKWEFSQDGINLYNEQISKNFLRVSTAEVY